MQKKKPSRRTATGRATADKLTLPHLTVSCRHEYGAQVCKHCVPDARSRATYAAICAQLQPQDQTRTTDGKPLPSSTAVHIRGTKHEGEVDIVVGEERKEVERRNAETNLAEYVEAAFGDFTGLGPYEIPDPDTYRTLASMPLLSVCGIACRTVIDSARTLLLQVSYVVNPLPESDRHLIGIIDAALFACEVICNG